MQVTLAKASGEESLTSISSSRFKTIQVPCSLCLVLQGFQNLLQAPLLPPHCSLPADNQLCNICTAVSCPALQHLANSAQAKLLSTALLL